MTDSISDCQASGPEQELQSRIVEQMGDKVRVDIVRARRLMATAVGREELLAALRYLRDVHGFTHVSTITGLDSGSNLEALYHLSNGSLVLTIRLAVPRQEPNLLTITDILPGAILYERELQDMFGFRVEGIPDPRRYVLPEDWPEGVYPLRKDCPLTPGNTGKPTSE
ncbi:MAG: NADH-quinone oxidoreductase subunit C [candidate division WOR-3 bacterium]